LNIIVIIGELKFVEIYFKLKYMILNNKFDLSV